MIKRIWDKEYQLYISWDEWYNPREYDNLWTFIMAHRNYSFADEKLETHWNSFEEDFAYHINDKYNIIDEFESEYEMSTTELETIYKYIDENIIFLSVSMYDHSWVSIYTWTWWCRWDSWQIGYIYVHRDKVKSECMRDITDETVREYLDWEIKYLNKYINWDFYFVRVEERDIKTIYWVKYRSEWEEIESCWWLDKPIQILDYLNDSPFTKEEIELCNINY